MLSKGTRVQHYRMPDFVGTVMKRHSIQTVTVFEVKWDSTSENGGIPMRTKDENGSNKMGYEEHELVVID